MTNKIKNIAQLKKCINYHKKYSQKIVFTNGCFDILHLGHVKYLEDSKKVGDILVVGINSNGSIKKIKGKTRPIMPEFDRLRIVAALESVDYVILFKENTPLKTAHVSLNYPTLMVQNAIPQIEQHCHVTVQMYYSECYHNLALIIKGTESDVTNACSELRSLYNTSN